MDLKGKTALVTGASRGLGRGVAVALGAAGAKVIAVARTQGGLEETDDAIQAAGGEKATLVAADVTDTKLMANLPQHLQARFGGLDLWISCAAYLGELTPVAQGRPEPLERAMAVNLHANAALIEALDPLLRKSDSGHAIFMTCDRAREPKAFWGAYSASKAALEILVKTYAAEAEKTGPKVCLFDPGAMATELRKQAMPGEDQSKLADPAKVGEALVKALQAGTMEHGKRLKIGS